MRAGLTGRLGLGRHHPQLREVVPVAPGVPREQRVAGDGRVRADVEVGPIRVVSISAHGEFMQVQVNK